jgi:hypothetical protein
MMNASAGAMEPSSASDPAVVDIRPRDCDVVLHQDRNAVQRTRTLPALRSASSLVGGQRFASDWSSITERSVGPCRSSASIRRQGTSPRAISDVSSARGHALLEIVNRQFIQLFRWMGTVNGGGVS